MAEQQPASTPLKGDAHPINQNGWSDAYPVPAHSEFPALEPPTLAAWLTNSNSKAEGVNGTSKRAGVDYLVVDVRRADCEYLIPGAINLPAHSFYQALPSLLPLLSRVPILIFHCGNRNTRGIRCAGWLADALAANGQLASDTSAATLDAEAAGKVRIFILNGGYNGWERDYGVLDIASRGQRAPAGTTQAVPL